MDVAFGGVYFRSLLIVFRLLEVREMSEDALLRMLDDATVMRAAASMLKPRGEWPALLKGMIGELAANDGPLEVDGTRILARR
ncbi:hypothetical protein OKW42_005197 [Paraburkholderia sp. WC7.3d]